MPCCGVDDGSEEVGSYKGYCGYSCRRLLKDSATLCPFYSFAYVASLYTLVVVPHIAVVPPQYTVYTSTLAITCDIQSGDTICLGSESQQWLDHRKARYLRIVLVP